MSPSSGWRASGIGAVRALKAGGANVFAWDDKEDCARGGRGRGRDRDALARLAVGQDRRAGAFSPGVPLTHPKPHDIVAHAPSSIGVEVIGDIELFAREIGPDALVPGRAPVIAVTGTNGKSTTTALIGHILAACGFDAQVGGNIGKAGARACAAGRQDDLCAGDVLVSDRSVARSNARCRGPVQHHA